jgi:hypothetical protein
MCAVTDSDALAAPAYKDRSTGLVVFGVLTVCLGAVAALFVPLMFFGQMAAARMHPQSVNAATPLTAASFYGFLAVVLIGLGIGSMRARRCCSSSPGVGC